MNDTADNKILWTENTNEKSFLSLLLGTLKWLLLAALIFTIVLVFLGWYSTSDSGEGREMLNKTDTEIKNYSL
jgi:hypothetical protein